MPVWKMQNAKVTLTHYCIFSVVAVGAVGRRLFSFSVNVLFFIFIDNRNVYVLVISMHFGGINYIIHNHFNVLVVNMSNGFLDLANYEIADVNNIRDDALKIL